MNTASAATAVIADADRGSHRLNTTGVYTIDSAAPRK